MLRNGQCIDVHRSCSTSRWARLSLYSRAVIELPTFHTFKLPPSLRTAALRLGEVSRRKASAPIREDDTGSPKSRRETFHVLDRLHVPDTQDQNTHIMQVAVS